MARGERLYSLQNLDQELELGQRRISEVKAMLGETEALRQARQALTTSEEEQRNWITKARDLELEIESLTNKISASEERLYGGGIANPKELADIQSEITSLKRRQGKLEDALLEAMVYGEEAEAAVDTCRAIWTDTEAQWQSDQSASRKELDALEARSAEAQEERSEMRQSIAADELKVYDKVRARFGPITVTTLRDGVCGYCAVAPASTKLARIRSGRELLQCSNCDRILLDI